MQGEVEEDEAEERPPTSIPAIQPRGPAREDPEEEPPVKINKEYNSRTKEERPPIPTIQPRGTARKASEEPPVKINKKE